MPSQYPYILWWFKHSLDALVVSVFQVLQSEGLVWRGKTEDNPMIESNVSNEDLLVCFKDCYYCLS